MAEFESFDIHCYDPDFLTLEWELSSVDVDYHIEIYRSESPEGEWEPIADNITDREIYHDWDVNLNSFNRKHYYKLKYVGETEVESDVEYLRNIPDAEAVDVSRRTTLLLDLYVGTPVFFLIRRGWGAKCPACYDSVTHKTTTSRCGVCYNTSYAGGFFEPIAGKIAKTPAPKTLQFMQLLEKEPDIRTFWTGNYPILKPRDVFVDNHNDRWIIKVVQPTEKMGSIMRQTFSAAHISKSDIIYDIEIPSFYDFTPSRDYHTWLEQTPALPS